jgi:predicted PhzF superfamily epimerase YddE/YHI9
MDFPSEPASEATCPLKLPGAIWQGKNRMDWVAVFPREEDVRRFVPDLPAIVAAGMRGLLITSPADKAGLDFVSRFFAPQYGIPEDPVTGSAHCCLAPLWAERLDKGEMRGYQASKRGGYVGVKLEGDRVQLQGQAQTVVKGELLG